MVQLSNCVCGVRTFNSANCPSCEAMLRAGVPEKKAVRISRQIQAEKVEADTRRRMVAMAARCPHCGK